MPDFLIKYALGRDDTELQFVIGYIKTSYSLILVAATYPEPRSYPVQIHFHDHDRVPSQELIGERCGICWEDFAADEEEKIDDKAQAEPSKVHACEQLPNFHLHSEKMAAQPGLKAESEAEEGAVQGENNEMDPVKAVCGSHIYHARCLHHWLEENPLKATCPACRQIYTSLIEAEAQTVLESHDKPSIGRVVKIFATKKSKPSDAILRKSANKLTKLWSA